MKLLPPVVDIPPDDPYRNDLFKRHEFGKSLYALFKSVEDGVVVCVDAPWGEGKSTFAKMWTADILTRGTHCIYFDAYAHDYANDPFIHFCGEIVALAEESFKESKAIKTLKEGFHAKAKRLGGELLSTGARIGAKALTLGIIKDSDLDSIDSIREDLAGQSSTLASQAVGNAIKNYTQSKDVLEEFRNQLSNLGKAVRDEQGFPLLIIVDELDRCRPDYALTLIERIKHLFSTENVSFLLLANTAQLKNYVKTVYGQNVDAVNYLHKFFSLYTRLPLNRGDSQDNEHKNYIHTLLSHYDFPPISRSELQKFLTALFTFYNFSLRETERIIAGLSVYYAQLPENRITDPLFISLLACIKYRFPDVFSKLNQCSISSSELFAVTKINEIPDYDYVRFPTEYVADIFNALLMSTKEFNELEDDHWVKKNYSRPFGLGLSRQEAIPFFCSELTKFSFPVS